MKKGIKILGIFAICGIISLIGWVLEHFPIVEKVEVMMYPDGEPFEIKEEEEANEIAIAAGALTIDNPIYILIEGTATVRSAWTLTNFSPKRGMNYIIEQGTPRY